MKTNKVTIQINKLLMLLLNVEVTTIKELADRTNLSEKTIRLRLDILDEFLKAKSIGSIKRQTRKGVWIEINKGKEHYISELLDFSSSSPIINTENSLDKLILYFLMNPDKTITLSKLANEFYLSIPTVSKLMDEAETWFDNYNIVLNKRENIGHWLSFEESDYRRAFVQFIISKYDSKEFKKIARELFHISYIDLISSIILTVENDWNIQLNTNSFNNLMLLFALTINRVNKSKYISESIDTSIKNHNEYQFIELISQLISNKINVDFNENDILFLCLELLSSSHLSNNQIIVDKNDSIDEIRLSEFIHKITDTVGGIMGINLIEDEMLKMGLELHLKPAIFRMKFGNANKANQYIDIREEFSSLYRAVWSTSILFEQEFGVQVNASEIALLALYFQAAIERQIQGLKVLLISSKSNAQNQFLLSNLKRRVLGNNTIDVLSLHTVKQLDLEEYSIILTTDQLDFNNHIQNIIRINPILSDDDVRNLNVKINEYLTSKRKISFDSMCHFLFEEDLIYKQDKAKNKNEILEKLIDSLESKNYVTKDYKMSVFNRENITQTSIGNNIAIPHGNQKYVLASRVAMMILDKPVEWDEGEFVNIILLLAIKIENMNDELIMKRFYEQYINQLSEKNENKKIVGLPTTNTIYKYLTKQGALND